MALAFFQLLVEIDTESREEEHGEDQQGHENDDQPPGPVELALVIGSFGHMSS
ncbi:MAG: hypothetical protein HND51_23195 [Chloroflexi bacterium]|nr:hypothetical protein [Chloroflexota bacterium]